MAKYEFKEDMAEISGIGGKYEEYCREMLVTGLEYAEEHDLDPKFAVYDGVYGYVESLNEDGAELFGVVAGAVDDCTGAMLQAVISHIMWIRTHSWDEWVERKIEEQKEEETEER